MRRWALLALGLTLAAPASAERCIAIDGDTLVCNRQKVRLTNVDAPELKAAGGRNAKRRLQALVEGREVVLRKYGQDRYGRLLAEVFVDGRRIEQQDIGPRTLRARK